VTADGATYKAAEYVGEAISALSMDGRLTISNMAVEMGTKVGLMEVDEKTLTWLKGRTTRPPEHVFSDPDAHFASFRYRISRHDCRFFENFGASVLYREIVKGKAVGLRGKKISLRGGVSYRRSTHKRVS
jgi:hypothetical protein